MKRLLFLVLSLGCAATGPTTLAEGRSVNYISKECRFHAVGEPVRTGPCMLKIEFSVGQNAGLLSIHYIDKADVEHFGGEKHSSRALGSWMAKAARYLDQPWRPGKAATGPDLEGADSDDQSWTRNVHDGTAVVKADESSTSLWFYFGDRAVGTAKFPDDGSYDRFQGTVNFASHEEAARFFHSGGQ